MQTDRTKNATRNIFWGMSHKICTVVAQLIIRSILLYTLGKEYLGLNGLFTSLLSVLSLAELGMGSALVYYLYRAIAEQDEQKICALMAFYKKFYHTVALVITGMGLLILPFLPYLVNADIPKDINLYLLYFFNLVSTVLAYAFSAYKSCILQAHQRSDLLSKLSFVLILVQYLAQIVILCVFKNYYLYCLVTPFIYLFNNVFVSFIADSAYPKYRAKGYLKQDEKAEIFRKVKALFFHKAGATVASSAGSIVVSACLGLAALAQFSNYQYVIVMLFAVMLTYQNSIAAGVGNSATLRTPAQNFSLFNQLLFAQGWICGFCSISLVCLFQNFIELWMGAEMLLPAGMVVLFALYFYTWKMQDTVVVFKDAIGAWEHDKFRPVVFVAVNITLSVALMCWLGMYGVLLSAVVCSVFIDLPWSPYALFKNYFQRKTREYYLRLLVYTLVNLVVGGVTYGVCALVPIGADLWQKLAFFVIKLFICVLVPNLLFFLLYRKTKEFASLWQKLKNTLKQKQ